MRILRNGDNVQLWATANDTYNWAHRAGAAWPCSTLSGHRVRVELQDGDLVDFALDGRDGDVDSNELSAFLNDMLRGNNG